MTAGCTCNESTYITMRWSPCISSGNPAPSQSGKWKLMIIQNKKCGIDSPWLGGRSLWSAPLILHRWYLTTATTTTTTTTTTTATTYALTLTYSHPQAPIFFSTSDELSHRSCRFEPWPTPSLIVTVLNHRSWVDWIIIHIDIYIYMYIYTVYMCKYVIVSLLFSKNAKIPSKFYKYTVYIYIYIHETHSLPLVRLTTSPGTLSYSISYLFEIKLRHVQTWSAI